MPANGPRPACQVVYCDNDATELLRSKREDLELHLCSGCASDFHSTWWEQVRGTAKLKPNPEGVSE